MTDYLNELFTHFVGEHDESPEDQQAEKLRLELTGTLEREQRALLIEFLNLTDTARCNECCHCFTSGLKLGIGMMTQLEECRIEF